MGWPYQAKEARDLFGKLKLMTDVGGTKKIDV